MSNIELESTDCPLCGLSDGKVRYEGMLFAPYGVRYFLHCGMGYLSPCWVRNVTEPLLPVLPWFTLLFRKGKHPVAVAAT